MNDKLALDFDPYQLFCHIYKLCYKINHIKL